MSIVLFTNNLEVLFANDRRYSKLLFAQIYIQMNNDFVAIRNDANIKGSMQKNPAQTLYYKSDFNLLQ